MIYYNTANFAADMACPICFEPFAESVEEVVVHTRPSNGTWLDTIRRWTRLGGNYYLHPIHKACLSRWAFNTACCPLCRGRFSLLGFSKKDSVKFIARLALPVISATGSCFWLQNWMYEDLQARCWPMANRLHSQVLTASFDECLKFEMTLANVLFFGSVSLTLPWILKVIDETREHFFGLDPFFPPLCESLRLTTLGSFACLAFTEGFYPSLLWSYRRAP